MKRNALILSFLIALLSTASCSGTTEEKTGTTDNAVQVTEAETEAETETEVSASEPETETEESAAESETEAEVQDEEANENELDLSALSTFEVTSEDLHDGVWDSDITNTSNGSNRSPQISWDAVEGAGNYVIYMIDTTASNWVHWRSVYEGETSLPAGWAPEKEYVGPYPPEGGPHDYEVYIFALKEPANKVKGALNSSSPHFFELIKTLDNDGGNVIAYGTVKGTYTHGD